MGCIKEQYETFKKAKEAASGLIGKNGVSTKVYKCPHCEKFHLTTIKKKLRKMKDEKYPFKYEYKKQPKMPEPVINIGYKPEPIIIHEDKAFNP